MENQQEELQQTPQEQPQKGYIPRPAWQVWGARIGLVVFIIFLILYYLIYFTGGGA